MRIPQINLKATGRRIEYLRKQAGLSVTDLQDILGFRTPQAIYKWQRGFSLPEMTNMVIISEAFDCYIEDILVLDYIEIDNKKSA